MPDKMARLLTIMGSGETAPTMVKVHRFVAQQLGPGATGILLDTPYGFQMNAADLSARAVTYFRDSVGMTMSPLNFRTAADVEGPKGDALAAKVAEAPLLFSGPGSPTYALRQWEGTLLPAILAEKLSFGGAVTFASAAALTLGSLTVPVYEIYKVGESPRWVEGLNLLSAVGLPVVVIPHYDNNEGGTHDTRFCYLGEQRLSFLEKEIPEGSFILGVDEHTAVTFDLESGDATIAGNGHITIRVKGRSSVVEVGVLPTAHLVEIAANLDVSVAGSSVSPSGVSTPASVDKATGAAPQGLVSLEPTEGTPLLQAVRAFEARFREAKALGDAEGMVSAILDLNEELWAWVADPNQSDELDRGRAALRSMVVELGNLARAGTRDPADVFGPFVDLLVESRNLARAERRFAEADSVRDQLVSLGVEIHDSPEGSTWERSAS